MNKGFTLVELAIVIVIIGLLVGGVLQGQELIRLAKVRNLVKELESYSSAVVQFKDKYKFLPGDLPNAPSVFGYTCAASETAGGARGDNRVEWIWINACGGEQVEVWRHLSLAKLIKGSYPGFCSGGCDVKQQRQFPISSSSDSIMYILQYGAYRQNHSAIYNQNGTFISMNGYTSSALNWGTYGGALTQYDASWIDQKIDDGSPSTGKSLIVPNLYKPDGSAALATDCLTSNQFNNLNSTNPECILFYKVD